MSRKSGKTNSCRSRDDAFAMQNQRRYDSLPGLKRQIWALLQNCCGRLNFIGRE
jgi:hypothetical protein